MASLKLTSATILTMNDALEVIEGDVSIRDGRIAAVGAVDPAWRHDRVIDVGGALVLPGFIQTHVHLCQTLFRGLADDLPLLDLAARTRLAARSRARRQVAGGGGTARRRRAAAGRHDDAC